MSDDLHPEALRDAVNERPKTPEPHGKVDAKTSQLQEELIKTMEYDDTQPDMYPAVAKEIENKGSTAEVNALHHVEQSAQPPKSPRLDSVDLHPPVMREAENSADPDEVERLHRVEREVPR